VSVAPGASRIGIDEVGEKVPKLAYFGLNRFSTTPKTVTRLGRSGRRMTTAGIPGAPWTAQPCHPAERQGAVKQLENSSWIARRLVAVPRCISGRLAGRAACDADRRGIAFSQLVLLLA
jgi:hypothetical protein